MKRPLFSVPSTYFSPPLPPLPPPPKNNVGFSTSRLWSFPHNIELGEWGDIFYLKTGFSRRTKRLIKTRDLQNCLNYFCPSLSEICIMFFAFTFHAKVFLRGQHVSFGESFVKKIEVLRIQSSCKCVCTIKIHAEYLISQCTVFASCISASIVHCGCLFGL